MSDSAHVPTPGKTPPGAPSKPERVDTIRKLMLTGQWVTGQTGVDLAKRWGLSISSLKADAAEASRSIGEAIGDRAEVMAKVWGMLERARQEALNEGHAAARSRALQGTAALMMKLAGLEAPTKLDVTVASGVKLTEMSVEDLRAIARGEQPPGAGSSTP